MEASRSLRDARFSAADWPRRQWWRRFGDEQLDSLIDQALRDSPTIGMAEARLHKAAALAGRAAAPLSAQAGAGASLSRQRLSEHSIFPKPIAGASFSQSEVTLNFAYQPDFWGGRRAAYAAALGEARAAEVDVFAARLSLSTGVAQAYIALERAFGQLDVAKRTLDARRSIFALVRKRQQAGLDSRVELEQAAAALHASAEQIARLHEAVALARDRLAALLGKGPDRGLAIKRPRAALSEAVALPSRVPADLLGRRPDVVAQRWRVEAARQKIASARAQFYPNINLAALIGLQSVSLSKLFSRGSAIPSFGPALQLPLFDGGRLRAGLSAADADYALAVQQYKHTLIDAMREVVDRLASLRSVDAQATELAGALSASDEAYRLARQRYRDGVGNYLQVLSAETQVLEQRSLQVDLRTRRLELSVALIRALGGGFEEGAGSAVNSGKDHEQGHS